MNRLTAFMQKVAADVYPEPRSEGHDAITSKMAREVAKRLPKGALVLDVGCGQGPALEWFTNAGFHPVGIALGKEDVDACVAAGFDAQICDQHDLSTFMDESFDCVWARHVLEHSIAPYWVLHEFHRVLVKGGTLYVEVPADDTVCAHASNPNHYSVMGYQMWINLIARAGFGVIEARRIDFPTPAGPDHYFCFITEKI